MEDSNYAISPAAGQQDNKMATSIIAATSLGLRKQIVRVPPTVG